MPRSHAAGPMLLPKFFGGLKFCEEKWGILMKLKKNGEKWGCLWDSKKKESG
jgi:hypothetical protein